MKPPFSALSVLGLSRNQNSREIDNWYHIASTAKDTAEIVECQRVVLKDQTDAASDVMTSFGAMIREQETSNEQLEYLNCNIELMNDHIKQLENATEAGFAATVNAIDRNSYTLKRGFAIIAESLTGVQKTLDDISQSLQRPYETKVLELRKQAESRLRLGLQRTGRDRDEDLHDSITLFREVTKNPIGNQDYVSWFNIGYILWKQHDDIVSAEEAFYRAARLSAHTKDVYYTRATWHQSHMQYLQGKIAQAKETIERIVPGTDDTAILFDSARYEAQLGRSDAAIKLLDEIINLNPTIIVTMVGEKDFGNLLGELGKLVQKKTVAARQQADANIDAWEAALALAKKIETELGTSGISIDSDSRNDGPRLRALAKKSDYINALSIQSQAEIHCKHILNNIDVFLCELTATANRKISNAESRITTAGTDRSSAEYRATTGAETSKSQMNRTVLVLLAISALSFGLGVLLSIANALFKSLMIRKVTDYLVIGAFALFASATFILICWWGMIEIKRQEAHRQARTDETKAKTNESDKLVHLTEQRAAVDESKYAFDVQKRLVLSRFVQSSQSTSVKQEPSTTSARDNSKGSHSVVLDDVGPKKIQVIKVIREATGLGLKEAKDIVDHVPSIVASEISRSAAELLWSKLRAEGASAQIT